jgi:tellurite resistance protein TehA-like permease
VVRLPLGAPDRIDWKKFLGIAAPLAGLVGVLSIFAAPVWLVLFPGSIFFAIHVYRRRQPGPIKTAQGARMGALVGLLNFAVLALYLVGLAVYDPSGYRQNIENSVHEAVARNPNPQAAQAMQMFSGTGGAALFTAMAMVFLLGLTLTVGGVSGALAASLGRNKSGP